MQQLPATLARIGVVLVMMVALFAATLVVYARSQGLAILSVQTGSMRPVIRPGDAVLVRHQPTRLKVGDIVSYRSLNTPGLTITHRLIRIDQERGLLTTKGDALDTPDPAFPASQVIGVMIHTVPFVGYGFDFIRQPVGLVAAVYLPAAIVIAWEIRRLMRHYERQHYTLYYY